MNEISIFKSSDIKELQNKVNDFLEYCYSINIEILNIEFKIYFDAHLDGFVYFAFLWVDKENMDVSV